MSYLQIVDVTDSTELISIADEAFMNDIRLEAIYLPGDTTGRNTTNTISKLQSIGSKAFFNNQVLNHVVLKEGLLSKDALPDSYVT